MAWLEPHKGRWRVRWRERGEKSPRSRYAPTKGIAKELKLEVERQLAIRGYTDFEPPPASPKLHVALEAWLRSRRAKLRPRTVSSYSDGAVHLLRFLAGWSSPKEEGADPETVELMALRGDALTDYYCWLVDSGRTRTTARKRASSMLLFWKWCASSQDYEAWVGLPPDTLDVRRDPVPLPIAPTWAEADTAVLQCTDWLSVFAHVARYTGLRRSAIMLLAWQDVDLDRAMLRVPAGITKAGASGRIIPISPHLVEYLAGLGRREGPLVPAPEKERRAARGDGRGHVDRDMRRAWKRTSVRREAWHGQPAHAFRKAIQTGCRALGQPWDMIEIYVGHRIPGTGGKHYLDTASPDIWPHLVAVAKSIPAVGEHGLILHRSPQDGDKDDDSSCKLQNERVWRRAMGIEPTGQRLPTRPDRF